MGPTSHNYTKKHHVEGPTHVKPGEVHFNLGCGIEVGRSGVSSALDRFNVHRCPTRWVFSGTGLELVTRQATVRYLYHSATAATRGLWESDLVILSHDQLMRTQLELAPPLLTISSTGGRLSPRASLPNITDLQRYHRFVSKLAGNETHTHFADSEDLSVSSS
ncbi:hypothetical protein TNCV_5109511 [Trichonephila clavipes]|nr:hypothetical protein TNCV_5109511 [Trichonephila clavipes]